MLTKDEIKRYKQILLDMRAKLWNTGDHITNHIFSSIDHESASYYSSNQLAEVGVEHTEREFSLAILENNSVLLDQIEFALEKIEEGTYGECEECGGRIPKKRLNDIPYATTCLKCAELAERMRY